MEMAKPARRVLVAESASRRFVKARRFNVRVVEEKAPQRTEKRQATFAGGIVRKPSTSPTGAKRGLRRAMTSPPQLSNFENDDDDDDNSIHGKQLAGTT